MKKTMLLLVIGILSVFLFSACHSDSSYREISDVLGIDISSGAIGTDHDSHGGFHGDGERFLTISFSDSSITETLAKEPEWKPLPFTENITALIYGISTEEGVTGPYVTDEDGAAQFPEIKNGYYYFIDRQNQNTDRHDDSNVLDRHSFNVTIAVYDIDTDMLYYAEYDT